MRAHHKLATLVALLLCSRHAAAVETDQISAVATSAAATAGSRAAPSLFSDPPAGEVAPASQVIINNKPINGEIATMSVPGAGEQPAVMTVVLDSKLLSSNPSRLSLALPGANLIITRRRDVPSPVPEVATASTTNGMAPVSIWIGEVAGQRRGTSSAILVTAENGGVYGKITYIERRTNKERTYTVAPLATGEADPIAAASLPADADAAAVEQHAARFPQIDTSKHVVMEVNEPNYMALLAQQHEQLEAWLKVRQPQLEAELAAQKATGASSPFGAASVDTSTPELAANSTLAPLEPLTDPQALAEAMAASAGNDSSTDPADYLAAATSLAASFSQLGTVPAIPTPTAVEVDGAGVTTPGDEMSSPQGRKLLQTAVTQDLLVVYTPAAAARTPGGDAALQNAVRQSVAWTNQAYTNSRLNVRLTLRLVAIRPVSYTEVQGDSGNIALDDVTRNRIPNVHTWRNELGADMVQIWSHQVGGCGVAWFNPSSADFFYGQVGTGCFDGRVTAHELGHNQGCTHNAEDRNGANTYAYGHRRCDLGTNNFMTIMSYPCPNNNWPPVLQQFSNPTLTRNNVPAGSATSNCARMLGETSTRIASGRPTVGGPNPPPAGGAITTSLSATKCVDAPSFNSGTQVHIWDCNGGSNQRFEHLPDGSLRWPGTNKCLDVRSSGTADGTRVQVWDCNGSPAQQWFYDAQRRLHPYVAPNKCLDLNARSTTNGNFLQIWECGTQTQQVFNTNVPDLTPGLLGRAAVQNNAIRSILNGLCTDVFSFNYQNTAPVVMWQCNNANNQRWQLDARGALRSTHNTAKCLDASSPNTGAAVYIFDCHTGPNQRWFSDRLGRLRPYSAPNRCLDIVGANPAAGTRIQLWECLDVNQQKWSIV